MKITYTKNKFEIEHPKFEIKKFTHSFIHSIKMSLTTQIDQDIKQAMLAKQADRLRGLRAIKSALLIARTEKGAAEEVTPEAETKVLQKLVKQRKESAEIYKTQNRDDLYQVEMEELEVIEYGE